MEKKRILIRVGIIILIVICILSCAVLAVRSNGLFAESKDGLWKAYVVKDTGSAAGGYRGYLFYYGNRQGDIGEINIEGLAKTKVEKSSLKPGFHSLGPVENWLIGSADRESYTFEETKLKEMKGASLGIIWKDSGEERYSSLIF